MRVERKLDLITAFDAIYDRVDPTTVLQQVDPGRHARKAQEGFSGSGSGIKRRVKGKRGSLLSPQTDHRLTAKSGRLFMARTMS